jgi:AcrR family transcriptional regulator
MSDERPTYAEAARALLKDRLLDAVDHLLRQCPWGEVTRAAIAADAGVSRQTVYNEFGSRDGIAQAYVLREAEWFLGAVREAVRANADDPHEALRAALVHFLTTAAEHPLLRAIVGHEDADDLLMLTIHSDVVVTRAGEALATSICETWPVVGRDDAQLLADTLVRLALSHAALPAGTPADVAAAMTRVVGPFVDQLLHGRPNTGSMAA